MKPNYLKRLRTLSIYLQRIDLIERFNHRNVEYHCSYTDNGTAYFEWIFYQLPLLFRQYWQYNDQAGAHLIRNRDQHPILSFRDFFGLDNITASAIIMPGYSYPPYFMPSLKETSCLGEIAEQINRYIQSKERELLEQNVKFKSVL